MDQKRLQESYMELQYMMQQRKQYEEQLEKIDQQLLELDYIKMSLDEVAKIEIGQEVLAPLSSGIFIRTKMAKNDELLVNVGGNTVVAKTPADTKELMDEQISQITMTRQQISVIMQKIDVKMEDIQKDFESMEMEER